MEPLHLLQITTSTGEDNTRDASEAAQPWLRRDTPGKCLPRQAATVARRRRRTRPTATRGASTEAQSRRPWLLRGIDGCNEAQETGKASAGAVNGELGKCHLHPSMEKHRRKSMTQPNQSCAQIARTGIGPRVGLAGN